MEKSIVIVGLIIAMVALPATASATSMTAPPVSTETDCAHYSITHKQEQLADLETELAKLKRRSPRRQYTAGIESQISTLRFQLVELQKIQPHR